MTKPEWDMVKEALKSPYSTVKLDVDGYEISLKLERISGYKLAIFVYIAECFRGKWLIDDCEERRRFMCKKVKWLYNRKKLTKKQIKLLDGEERLKFNTYSPYFTAFVTLKSQLINNNSEIKLVGIK